MGRTIVLHGTRFYDDNNNNDNNNNNINNNNSNNNTDDDTDDDTGDEIRDKIRDIKNIFNRLGNMVTHKDRKKITKKLYEIQTKENLLDNEKREIYGYLAKLVNPLTKKKNINIMIVMI